jgi:SepF-like predicted cell division protein (DUF552 family)
MALLDKILKKLKSEKTEKPGEDFIEVNPLEEERKVNVNIEKLDSYSDTERIQSLVREGSVVFLRIKELREKDINELKKAVDKLRKTCTAINGDIVGVDEDFLIITPSFVRIDRGKAA